MAILVLGLGNLLMGDDGFGPRVVELLEERHVWSETVRLVDGGTLGLDLLPQLEGVKQLLIIDAIDLGSAPGTLFRLKGDEVPRAFANKLSVHQMGLQDLLAVAELQGHLPAELVVWGAQAGTIELGLELTPAVATAVEEVALRVAEELRGWGNPLPPR